MDSSIYHGNVLYADCFAGIAGDMFLASLIDISVGEEYLRNQFRKIPLENYEVKVSADKRGGIRGLRFDVSSGKGHGHRHLQDIIMIITQSGLSDNVKSRIINIFTLLAEAEAKVHGDPVDHVHFHEVGAVDSVIDIAGAMIMLEHMGWPEVVFSPLNIGSGTLKCEHGILPVPSPAACELLSGIEVFSEGDSMERVTPTGAALVKALGGRTSAAFPAGKIIKSGVGLGTREGTPPNLLRVSLIEPSGEMTEDSCIELSANIDDMTPQDLSFAMDKLFEAGALDVWFENIQMKKNRPAVKLCCLGRRNTCKSITEVFLRHTTTLGVRRVAEGRTVLSRRIDAFSTKLGVVRIKSALSGSRTVKQMPEFEDIRRIASDLGTTVSDVRALLACEDFTIPDQGVHRDKKQNLNTVYKHGKTDS